LDYDRPAACKPVDQCPELPDNFELPANEPDIIRKHQTWVKSTYPSINRDRDIWRKYLWGINRFSQQQFDATINKARDEQMPALEKQHADYLDKAKSPDPDWWGSVID
jgi:hypothetical protein